jgi:hypothetical protein
MKKNRMLSIKKVISVKVSIRTIPIWMYRLGSKQSLRGRRN